MHDPDLTDYIERLEDAAFHLLGDWERAEETGVSITCPHCNKDHRLRVPPLLNMRHYNEVVEEARRRRILEGRPSLVWKDD